MKCSRITLFDRKEKLSNNTKHNCNYRREFNPQLQNYVPWLNKPHSLHEDDRPYLTVCNLVLPSNIPVSVDSGALSERWVKKRPRLQSGKIKYQNTPRPKTPEEDDQTVRDDDTETDSQVMEIQQVLEEYEIDENVQRLIQEAAEYDQRVAEKELEEKQDDIDELEEDKRRGRKASKNRTKERNETKSKPKLTRTLSLSRPPSPETIQVIRVDVTSNYSPEEVENMVEETDSDSEDDDQEENEIKQEKNQVERNRLSGIKSLIKQASAGELTLQCQKLELSDRKVFSAIGSDRNKMNIVQ